MVSKLDTFEEMEHEFPFGTFYLEKQDYRFRCSVMEMFRKCSTGMTQKFVFHLLSDWIFQKICVSGKHPP